MLKVVFFSIVFAALRYFASSYRVTPESELGLKGHDIQSYKLHLPNALKTYCHKPHPLKLPERWVETSTILSLLENISSALFSISSRVQPLSIDTGSN